MNDNISQDLNSQFCIRYSIQPLFVKVMRYVGNNEVFLQFICFIPLLLFKGIDMTRFMSTDSLLESLLLLILFANEWHESRAFNTRGNKPYTYTLNQFLKTKYQIMRMMNKVSSANLRLGYTESNGKSFSLSVAQFFFKIVSTSIILINSKSAP